MAVLDGKNVIEFLVQYFIDIGVNGHDVNQYLRGFKQAIVRKLPAVCLLTDNKPKSSRSNQSHIHITGDARYFFFSKDLIDGISASSDNIPFEIEVSKTNIDKLNNPNSIYDESDLRITVTTTHKKIEYRSSSPDQPQVQVSRINDDGSTFIKLREGLYLDDLLIFLKGNDGRVFCAGIPKQYYGKYYDSVDVQKLKLPQKNRTVKTTEITKEFKRNIENDKTVENKAIAAENMFDTYYQEQIDDVEASTTIDEPEPIIERTSQLGASKKKANRDPSRAKEALKDGKYLCEINNAHIAFSSKKGHPYVEAHHLIPLYAYTDFEYHIDVKANIIALCPNCHRKLHHAKFTEIKDDLALLYKNRVSRLDKCGIKITLEELLRYYKS